MVKLGKYQHYKGNFYEVIGTALHSETKEELVVYKDDKQMWVRPLSMFLEEIEKDGKRIPRFKFIEDS